MFCLYSKGCEYTLRAILCTLHSKKQKSFRVEDACREAGVPEAFTRKAFQRLAQQGLLEAVRGPGGGYRLRDAASEVSILEMIHAVDGEEAFENCIMGLSVCGDEDPCPIHPVWKKLKEKLIQQLDRTTLEQIAVHHRQNKKASLETLLSKEKRGKK